LGNVIAITKLLKKQDVLSLQKLKIIPQKLNLTHLMLTKSKQWRAPNQNKAASDCFNPFNLFLWTTSQCNLWNFLILTTILLSRLMVIGKSSWVQERIEVKVKKILSIFQFQHLDKINFNHRKSLSAMWNLFNQILPTSQLFYNQNQIAGCQSQKKNLISKRCLRSLKIS
jgi:hypothetical protein